VDSTQCSQGEGAERGGWGGAVWFANHSLRRRGVGGGGRGRMECGGLPPLWIARNAGHRPALRLCLPADRGVCGSWFANHSPRRRGVGGGAQACGGAGGRSLNQRLTGTRPVVAGGGGLRVTVWEKSCMKNYSAHILTSGAIRVE